MNILVGYEESEVGQKALTLAGTYAKSFGGKVYVAMSMVGGKDAPEGVVTKTDDILEKIRADFEKEGVVCEPRLLARGLEPGEDIVRFAEDMAIDHIIIGIKKTSKVQKMLFGSNAQYIILHAPCPVVTVR